MLAKTGLERRGRRRRFLGGYVGHNSLHEVGGYILIRQDGGEALGSTMKYHPGVWFRWSLRGHSVSMDAIRSTRSDGDKVGSQTQFRHWCEVHSEGPRITNPSLPIR